MLSNINALTAKYIFNICLMVLELVKVSIKNVKQIFLSCIIMLRAVRKEMGLMFN